MPNKLEIYQQVLKEEFIREWKFLEGVIAGHNREKSGFTDQLIIKNLLSRQKAFTDALVL